MYSDDEVILVLQNMHVLLMKKKNRGNVSNCSGDGTGYSLTIKKHYASDSHKLREKNNRQSNSNFERYVFSFRLMDLDTRMYAAFGTSFRSERDANNKALAMAKGIPLQTIRLDKYYSGQGTVEEITELFGKEVSFYLIPKMNARIRGPIQWRNMLSRLVKEPDKFLGEYYQRNQSESGFSEDKRRLGWRTSQRREDRIETNNACTFLWHNLFWYGRS